jgi:hypothetical protein
MKEEIWKDIPGYAGHYQVSDFGNVRSLDKFVRRRDKTTSFRKGRILKLAPNSRGYLVCSLSTNGTHRVYYIHQLIAMAFLSHKPDGLNLVVDHINNIKTDNRLENLQLVSQRYNSTKDTKGTSKYTGVSWHSRDKKWYASIEINRKKIHLGYFTDEDAAALAYQKALYSINK